MNHFSYLLVESLSYNYFRGTWGFENNKTKSSEKMGKSELFFAQQHYKPYHLKLVINLFEGWFFDDFNREIIYDIDEVQVRFDKGNKYE